ncbi:MAG: Cache 3/Cache 2 fusion domain-containing protein [Comamonadaceae bacterium]|nr:Cache 3/Cache 2 fusion domain-containing protein [Comamonadaceae bacterium]
MNNNFDVVDAVRKQHNATATVFVKDGDEFVRVSTKRADAGGQARRGHAARPQRRLRGRQQGPAVLRPDRRARHRVRRLLQPDQGRRAARSSASPTSATRSKARRGTSRPPSVRPDLHEAPAIRVMMRAFALTA